MPRKGYVMVEAMIPDNYPDQGLPGPQPPFPQPPIAGWPGGLPGGGGFPGQGGPERPPLHPGWPTVPGWPGGSLPGGGGGNPVYPSHPIHSGPGGEIGGPPGIWGGGNVPYPTPPIYIPIVPPPTEGNPHPEHPIYIPIQPPLGFWGPSDPRPTNPITNPGDPNNPGAGQPKPPISEEVIEKVKKLVDFLYGNMPENPNPHPEPVKQ